MGGIGLGVPGPVKFATGRPIALPIVPGWDDNPVRERLARRYGVPVWVDNEVNVMALGELRADLASGERHVIYVKTGTGRRLAAHLAGFDGDPVKDCHAAEHPCPPMRQPGTDSAANPCRRPDGTVTATAMTMDGPPRPGRDRPAHASPRANDSRQCHPGGQVNPATSRRAIRSTGVVRSDLIHDDGGGEMGPPLTSAGDVVAGENSRALGLAGCGSMGRWWAILRQMRYGLSWPCWPPVSCCVAVASMWIRRSASRVTSWWGGWTRQRRLRWRA